MVIPTLLGGDRFRSCLEALATQEHAPKAVVVVDSGSDDGSVEAAQEHGAEVLSIPRSEFRHGPTRSLGFEALPPVDVVVFLVQDAVPQGPGFLGHLASALEDPNLGAVTARQVPPAGSGVLTHSSVERSPCHSEEARRVGPFSETELSTWGADRWRGHLSLDSIALAVRSSVFEAVRFRDTDFGEDALLAHDLLWGGWALGHVPQAVVEHGHEYDVDSVAERYEQDARFFRERFGLRVRAGWMSALKGWAAELAADRRWLADHPERRTPEALRASSSLRWAQVMAQLRGSRGPLGALPDRPQLSLDGLGPGRGPGTGPGSGTSSNSGGRAA